MEFKNNLIHPWQGKTKIVENKINNLTPKVTIVMPVFNQELIIENTLNNLCLSMGYSFNIIIINDGSDDETEKKILNFFYKNSKKFSLLSTFVIITNEFPIYETACDNQGFKYAKTEFIIELQSDILIQEKNFDIKMIKSLEYFNVGTVSGRHVHSFSLIDNNLFSWFKYPLFKFKSKINPYFQSAGLIGDKLFYNDPVNIKRNFFYVGETNARGPWLVRKSDMVKLNYLDEKNFFLGNDDHDYNRRLYNFFGKKAGYLPIKQKCSFENGSTRKKRNGLNLKIYNYLKKKKIPTDFNYFLSKYRPYTLIQSFPITKNFFKSED